MMYIRTKDKIYKVFESPLNDDEDFVYVAPNGCISETDILNQSENLEELCDEFIYDYGKDKDRFKNDSLALKILRANNNEKVNIYGAIWTNKGLIYVAKMNDKGDLELI